MTSPFLTARRLDKTFVLHAQGGQALPVMRGLDLSLSPGECLVLAGRSGIGKSTLLKMVNGNYRISGGSLTLLQLWSWLREAGVTPRRTLHLCFLVQEESGLLGAKGWVRRNEVETFVAVDSTPMPRGTDLTLDGRPGTWSRDSQVHFDQGLIADFATAAGRAGTQLQYVVYTAAASDATGVLQVGGAERCATIGYPRENSHGYEVVRWSVFGHTWPRLELFVAVLAFQGVAESSFAAAASPASPPARWRS